MSLQGPRVPTPPVTIGMPVYNDERYLRLALDDLLEQSFTDFELIISDNASTDASPEICREYAAKDGRIRYVRQQTNLGALRNFLFLLDQARGEFFMWAASDDQWHKEYVARLVAALRRDKSLAVAFSPFQYMDEEGRKIGAMQRIDYSGSWPVARLIKFNMNLNVGADAFFYGLFRRDMIKDLRIRQWRGINSNILTNMAYPVLSFCLARGGFISVGDQPMWMDRIHIHSVPRHSAARNWSPMKYLFAFILRKANLAWYNLEEIYRGRRNPALILALLPFVVLRCIADVLLLVASIAFRREFVVGVSPMPAPARRRPPAVAEPDSRDDG